MKTAHEAIAAMKAELERRKAIVQNAATQIQNEEKKKHYFGIVEEYVDLLSFLDTLPDKPKAENKGCGIEFPHFGATYPDAKCINGYLWDMDSYEDGCYTIGGDDPCPICNTEIWIKEALDDEMFKTREEALQYVEWLKSKYPYRQPDEPNTEQPVEGRLEMAARHVWESWNGGTMDDVRRDMKALGNVLNARKEQPVEGLEEEYKDYVENDPVYSKLVNRNAGLCIARHFAEWGAEHLKR